MSNRTNCYNFIKFKQSMKQTNWLFVLLIARIASIAPIYNTFQSEIDSIPKGFKPVLVQKMLKINFTYNLAGVRDAWIPWTKFPELDDNLELEFSQNVRISYRIPVIFFPITSHFFTRLLINNVEDRRFYFHVGNVQERTTAIGEGHVWLGKGTHNIRIEYVVTNNVPIQKPYEWGLECFLEIEYYKLVKIN